MWPGSEAHIPDVEPTYMDKYNGSETLSRKVKRVFEFLDLPGDHDQGPMASSPHRRPQFIAFYVPNVDHDGKICIHETLKHMSSSSIGHVYGPNSTEIRQTISAVDSMLAELLEGLRKRNLTEIVNVIVVSDHGMATTSTARVIQLDDIVDLNLIDRVDGWPLQGLRPKDVKGIPQLYQRLRDEASKNPNFEVYLRENMPERWHFSHNDRIAPLWIIPKTGWAIAKKEDFDVAQAKAEHRIYMPRGIHGYDNEHPLMRAIFVARGPSFPHKPNSRVLPFRKSNPSTIAGIPLPSLRKWIKC
jgi:predicted AlkP superfamily pyrophosphatase or phosphodiesterase